MREDAQDWFTVVRGEPDAVELAVIAAVLFGLAGRGGLDGAGGGRNRPRWRSNGEYRAPGSWE